jgi:hypothetical protein
VFDALQPTMGRQGVLTDSGVLGHGVPGASGGEKKLGLGAQPQAQLAFI